jgi:hypothetical protein
LFYLKGVAPKSIQTTIDAEWEGDWVENWHDNEWNLYKINKESKDEDNPHRDEDKTHLFGG